MNMQEDTHTNTALTQQKAIQYKAGFVAILGRPSVGKSSFINTVCGHNVAVISPFPQTTRNIIKGIVTKNNYQIIFLDTPGIYISESMFGKHLTKQATMALKDADSILYMLDATRMPEKEEEEITHMLQTYQKTIFVCINKMDKERGTVVHAHLDMLRNTLKEKIHACHFISALDGTNILPLVEDIASILPTHTPYYHNEYYTDQNPDFRICEQVRAAALDYVKEEIPYALYIEILESNIKHLDANGNPTHVFVRAQLVVERESQQSIVIGKGGSMIKQIRHNAMKRIAPLFDYNVQLELRVGTKKKWRKNKDIIQQLGLC